MNGQPELLHEAQGLFDYTQSLRRDFHMHPELGFQEVRTAGIIARELTALGLEVHTGIAETGVVALLEGEKKTEAAGQPAPLVALLRFDMDALPIHEATGAEYASQTPGVMHACGHDGHVAVGLAVARLLNAHRSEFSGTVKLVFQPAEEGLGGAERMIAEGILDAPRPQTALALHLWNEKPVGWVGITPGPIMAAGEIFKIRIKGKGAHGALPHQSVDPVVAAAQVISALQTIASRNVSPYEAAVVSVTRMQGGETFNVIPSEVMLQGTIRTFDPAVRGNVLARFSELVSGVTSAMGCVADVDVKSLTPAVVNDPWVTARVQAAARNVLPGSQMSPDYQVMVSEDMAYILQKIPGCFFFVGCSNREKGLDAAHHHPCFDFDEQALPKAAALMAGAALQILNHSGA